MRSLNIIHYVSLILVSVLTLAAVFSCSNTDQSVQSTEMVDIINHDNEITRDALLDYIEFLADELDYTYNQNQELISELSVIESEYDDLLNDYFDLVDENFELRLPYNYQEFNSDIKMDSPHGEIVPVSAPYVFGCFDDPFADCN